MPFSVLGSSLAPLTKRFSMKFLSLWLFLAALYPLYAEETFLLVDGDSGQILESFGNNLDESFTPACTFNIALSLMGYDANILKDARFPVWEPQLGQDDSPQTPLSWMKESCVWYSKKLALELTADQIEKYLAWFDYGNQNFSGGLPETGESNPPWISSSLKISITEQVNFIRKMLLGTLPISNHTLQMTKRLLFKEELVNGWILNGKTGLGTDFSENPLKVRWFVGWIERKNQVFPFAYQFVEKNVDASQTLPRVKQLIQKSLSNDNLDINWK